MAAHPPTPFVYPGSSGFTNLGDKVGSLIDLTTGQVVDALSPMIPQVLPVAVGFALVLYLIELVMDHAPGFGWRGESFDPTGVVVPDAVPESGGSIMARARQMPRR